MSSPPHQRRYEPDPRVVDLVRQYGAPRVALMFGLPGDTIRRYVDGACQRANRWWIELHLETVTRDLAAASRPGLALARPPSTPPGEGA